MSEKMKLQFKDRLSGTRYSNKQPIGSVKGTELYEKFTTSPRWKLIEKNNHIEHKNDNRTDIFRGFIAIFQEVNSKKKVQVKSIRSNTGKTIEWLFSDEF